MNTYLLFFLFLFSTYYPVMSIEKEHRDFLQDLLEERDNSNRSELHRFNRSIHSEYSFSASKDDLSAQQVAIPELSKGLLHYAAVQSFNDNRVLLTKRDVDLSIGGRAREEGLVFYKPLTFRDDFNDNYSFFRSKFNLDMTAVYGRRTHNAESIAGAFRLTAFNFWQDPDIYSPILEEPVAFNRNNPIKEAEISIHHHNRNVTIFFVEEAWVDINVATLHESLKNVPLHFKVGYFPFKVGRGISLGDYYDGAIDYMGWKSDVANSGNNTQRPNGIQLSYAITPSLVFDFYYSKWRERTHGPDFTRKHTKIRRLDIDLDKPEQMQRGVTTDRDLFAARLRYLHENKDTSLYVEPYWVYVDAPGLEVEFKEDSSAKFSTIGAMAEFNSGGWSINAEFSGQIGQQVMHAIDRNHLVVGEQYYSQLSANLTKIGGNISTNIGVLGGGRLDKTIGMPAKYHSHIALGVDETPSKNTAIPYQAYYTSQELEIINSSENRNINAQGNVLQKNATYFVNDTFQSEVSFPPNYSNPYDIHVFKTGVESVDNLNALAPLRSNSTLHNANIPFGAGRRFRPEYALDLSGFMGLLDVRYEFQNARTSLGGAAGYLSGDAYPFNEEKDAHYNGFIPLRDGNYSGLFVSPYAMFAARQLPRPIDFSDNLMYAPNNTSSLTNLSFVGFGICHKPLQKKEELLIEANFVHFWSPHAPYAWDKKATRTFGDTIHNGLYAYAQSDILHFSGHNSSVRASHQLGWEVNATIRWRPTHNFELGIYGACYAPGQLYKDIEGTPNFWAIRFGQDGNLYFGSLGSQVAFGGMCRMTYWF